MFIDKEILFTSIVHKRRWTETIQAFEWWSTFKQLNDFVIRFGRGLGNGATTSPIKISLVLVEILLGIWSHVFPLDFNVCYGPLSNCKSIVYTLFVISSHTCFFLMFVIERKNLPSSIGWFTSCSSIMTHFVFIHYDTYFIDGEIALSLSFFTHF